MSAFDLLNNMFMNRTTQHKTKHHKPNFYGIELFLIDKKLILYFRCSLVSDKNFCFFLISCLQFVIISEIVL